MKENCIVGIVSLGAMGSSLASSLLASGHSVIWASQGRSQNTVDRARRVGAVDVGTIKELSDRSDVIMSIGFGNSGPETADLLIHNGFDKLFVDFNSLWGESSENLFYETVAQGNYQYVDGAIHGYPLKQSFAKDGLTRLMLLHGEQAEFIGTLFTDDIWTIIYCEDKAKKENRIMSQNRY